MRFDICTIFPNIFDSYINESILKRAQEKNIIEIHTHDIRAHTKDKHNKVDDTPYGGGPGMVMTPQPLYDCISHVKTLNNGPVIFLTPQGEQFTQEKATKLSKLESCIFVCGRYEGIDQRIRDLLVNQEVSIGNYVLTGGELPALTIIDAVTRLLPGALGHDQSALTDSFSPALQGKKEHPQYTKPAEFEGLEVPEVLLSGNHAAIEKWRQENLK